MAEPARKPDNQPSEQPPKERHLHSVEGGGEGGPSSEGSLSSAPESNRETEESSPPGADQLRAIEGGGESSEPDRSWYRPSNQPPSGPERLKDQEEAVEKLPRSYGNPSRGERFSQVLRSLATGKRKRVVIGGGLVGLIIAVAFSFLSFVSGPFQFIQFGQWLERSHLAGHNNTGEDRVSRIYRFYKSGGDVRELRVGWIRSSMAKKIELRFKNAGITLNETGPYRYLDSLEIDRNHSRWRGMDDAAIERHFRNEGVNVSRDVIIERNRVIVKIPTGFFQRSGPAHKWALKEIGVWRVFSPVQSRAFGKFTGVAWHPMRWADRRVNEGLVEYWDKIKARYAEKTGKGKLASSSSSGRETIEDGDTPEERQRKETQNAWDDDVKKAAADVDQEVTEVANETTEKTSHTEDLAGSLKRKLLVGGAATAASATVVLCIIYAINEDYEALKYDRLILPMTRVAWHSVSLMGQVMNGRDVDPEQLGAFNTLLNDPVTGSWLNGRTMQAEQGRPQTGPPVDEKLSAVNKGSPFQPIIDKFNALTPEGFPDAKEVCSTIGQILTGVVTVVISILSGGAFSILSYVTQAAFAAVVTPFAINYLASLLAGSAVDTYRRGPHYADLANYGARLSANSIGLTRGGVELESSETKAIKTAINEQAEQEFANKSLKYRLFDPYDPKSAMAKLLDVPDPEVTANIAKMSQSVFSVGKMLGSLPSLFASTAHAQPVTLYNYGFPEYGFSLDDLNNPAVADPYVNARDVKGILESRPDLIDKANRCFGIAIGQTPVADIPDTPANEAGVAWSAKSVGLPNPYDKTSDDRYELQDCKNGGLEWLRVRFFILDSVLMDAAYCYETGDPESCDNVGFSPQAESGGGSTDCSDYADATWEQINQGGVMSPDTPPNQYRQFIVDQAPGRTCSDWKLTEKMPADVLARAVPNDERQYFGQCTNGNNCIEQTDENGRKYIEVKYRDPPVSGSNTINIYLDGGSGSPPPAPPGPPSPPPCSPPRCLPLE